DEDRAIHVGVAARFVHQESAQMVGIVAHPGALFEDGAFRDRGIAGYDDAQRLAAGVHVDDASGGVRVGWPNIFCSRSYGVHHCAKLNVPLSSISRAAFSTAPKASVVSLEPTEMRFAPASDKASTEKPPTASTLTGRDTEEHTVRTISTS